MPDPTESLYLNPSASSYHYSSSSDAPDLKQIRTFHESLPSYRSTPLIPLPTSTLTRSLRTDHDPSSSAQSQQSNDTKTYQVPQPQIFIKDESTRLGLAAFKILGASWGIYRALSSLSPSHPSPPPQPPSLSTLSTYLQTYTQSNQLQPQKPPPHLFAATDGNHGRAVARMASLLGIPATIYVPRFTDQATKDRISGEGATVHAVQGDYDAAVAEAYKAATSTPGGLLVQDNAFDHYEEIPRWIVEGYSTLLGEVEEQLAEKGLKADLIVTPIGVGSLGQATVMFAKSHGREIKVLAVEPDGAGCLNTSLRNEKTTTIETGTTIMDGMNCGTVSPISWPILKEGVDASVTVSDIETHRALLYLKSQGVNAGPCGAATLAGLIKAILHGGGGLGLDEKSVVVLLSTEGARPYPIPHD